MANDKMREQMAGKGGFIAALDQSGGSTPGALRLYGIPDSEYAGDEAKMYELMHEFRDAHHQRARLHRRQGDRRHPVRADDGRAGEGQARAVLPVGGSRRRADRQGRQGARARQGRRAADEADAGPRRAARPGGQARRVRHQDALGHQPRLEGGHRRHRQAAVRDRRADRRARPRADPRAGSLDQGDRQGGGGDDPARRAHEGPRQSSPRGGR